MNGYLTCELIIRNHHVIKQNNYLRMKIVTFTDILFLSQVYPEKIF